MLPSDLPVWPWYVSGQGFALLGVSSKILPPVQPETVAPVMLPSADPLVLLTEVLDKVPVNVRLHVIETSLLGSENVSVPADVAVIAPPGLASIESALAVPPAAAQATIAIAAV
jgi:hypothetical protein